ncbi:MAG: hypothetical protein R2710_30045 [Acidimicrobiales bacterium]
MSSTIGILSDDRRHPAPRHRVTVPMLKPASRRSSSAALTGGVPPFGAGWTGHERFRFDLPGLVFPNEVER